ncbi:penicillin-binding protein 2 [bacterium]|nr:penicillin-binding protein 2 [Candidatus Elulimicrobium humile]
MKNLFDNDITPEDLFLDRDGNSALYINNFDNYKHFIFLAIVAILLIGSFWFRIFQLQFGNTKEQDLVQSRIISKNYIKPLRGNIYDRNGIILAYNEVVFSLVLKPELLPKDEENKNQLIQDIRSFFNLDEAKLTEVLNSQESEIILIDNMSQEQAITFEISQNKYPGFELIRSSIRQYPDSQYFSHLIGYTGKLSETDIINNPRYLRDDIIGKKSIEKVYEAKLKGEYGLINPRNSEIPIKSVQNGNSIQLTIDSELQKVVQDSIQEVLTENGLTKAAAIVMNPQNGEVLSMVSLPSFDNNLFTKGITQKDYDSLIENKDNPLLNRCIAGEYAPASTVKPLIASGLLQEGIITAKTTINDPLGKLVVENPYSPENPFIYPDWKIHGISDTYKSISDSVNVFYYTFVGGTPKQKGLGIEKLAQYYRYYGFGAPTQIDLTGEVKGNVADPAWKKQAQNESWLLGDTYNTSIGQGGMLTTPLQILNSVNAIANKGKLYKPYLYQGIRKNDTIELDIKENNVLQEIPVSQENYDIVIEAMRKTITDGTGYQLQDLPFSTAGKTGTAQTGRVKNNSWFVSYGPVEKPQLSIIVLVEEGDESFKTTIPITKKVYEWYYHNKGFKE